MAEVAGVLLFPEVQVFFERMESGVFDDFFRRQELINEGLLQKLKIALLSVSALLEDAVKKQLTNPAVKEWLYKLKDAVYDAEDILYEIATEALRRYDAAAFLSEALQRKSSTAQKMKQEHGDPTGFTIEIEPALISTEFKDITKRHGITILPRKLGAEFQTSASKVRIGFETIFSPFRLKNIARKHARQKDELSRQKDELSRQDDEVRDILKYIARQKDELSRQKDELDIVLGELKYLALDLKEGVGGESLETLPTTYLDEESGIFGWEDDKEKIIDLLLPTKASGTENMHVIGIVGVMGIGKTTLAQLVYNDPRVESHFELKAWVCFSPEFNEFRIMKAVLESVTSSTYDIKDSTKLQITLEEKFMGKKFLLVLDDIWNKSRADWEMFSYLYDSGAPGTMVIVTTRNRDVASLCMRRAGETYYLKGLQDENCWSLFARYAFQGNSDRCEAREVIGKQIIKKCKGNPLAAKTIGALLQSKVDVAEWAKVNSELSDLSNVEEPILLTLISSYRDLPLHLKRCFAYCSIFPMKYVFEKVN